MAGKTSVANGPAVISDPDPTPTSVQHFPWDRLPGEPSAAFEAFRRYRDMPSARRTIKGLNDRFVAERDRAEEQGKFHNVPATSEVTLRKWQREYHWDTRAAQWDDEIDRAWQTEQLTAVRDASRRQWEASRDLQETGQEALTYIDPVDLAKRFPQEVRRFITEGAEMERVLLDMNRKDEDDSKQSSPTVIIQLIEQLVQQIDIKNLPALPASARALIANTVEGEYTEVASNADNTDDVGWEGWDNNDNNDEAE